MQKIWFIRFKFNLNHYVWSLASFLTSSNNLEFADDLANFDNVGELFTKSSNSSWVLWLVDGLVFQRLSLEGVFTQLCQGLQGLWLGKILLYPTVCVWIILGFSVSDDS